MPTPWSPYVTQHPEMIVCDARPGMFLMGVGNDPERMTTCLLNVNTRKIVLLAPGMSRSVPMFPYHLTFPRWTGRGAPVIRLHPFALFHLLLADQAPRRVMVETVDHFVRVGSEQFSTPIAEACPLLGSLGVERTSLSFRSDFNFALVGR